LPFPGGKVAVREGWNWAEDRERQWKDQKQCGKL
jgi:hypothetical protein